jgi:chromosome segregation ATPase
VTTQIFLAVMGVMSALAAGGGAGWVRAHSLNRKDEAESGAIIGATWEAYAKRQEARVDRAETKLDKCTKQLSDANAKIVRLEADDAQRGAKIVALTEQRDELRKRVAELERRIDKLEGDDTPHTHGD